MQTMQIGGHARMESASEDIAVTECADSPFTGTHVWEIQEDKESVRCRFCRKKANPERTQKVLDDAAYLKKTNRLVAGFRGLPSDDKKNAAITKKNRGKK